MQIDDGYLVAVDAHLRLPIPRSPWRVQPEACAMVIPLGPCALALADVSKAIAKVRVVGAAPLAFVHPGGGARHPLRRNPVFGMHLRQAADPALLHAQDGAALR